MTPLSSAQAMELTRGIAAPDEQWRTRARAHLDTLTKPLGSLGRLEDLAAQLAAICGCEPALPFSKAVYVFAADHGITAEGVSAYPQAVTQQMVLNFLAEGAAINVLARLHNVQLHVVDVGVDADFHNLAGLLHHKVCRGTRNMLREPAMSDAELALALRVGTQLAQQAADAGHTLLAIGEMGIGNTTAASAITCALTGASAARATGRGTGLDDDAHVRKIAIVTAILDKHFTSPAKTSPLHILRCAGGLEIAAMTGMVLGAARLRLPLIIDGFIATAAASLAVAIAPAARGFLIAGHRSAEPGHQVLLDLLQLTPVLDLHLRLGEGSGAVLAMPILESAVALYSQMATFASAGVSEARA
jgi:nicotinate-nucleotide--dimethylbenzimidazole phosphoribosyltransferase